MDRLTAWPHGRCIVVHSNRLVSEDLRQLLLAEGAGDILLASRIEDIAAQSDAIVFIEASASSLNDIAQVQTWMRLGTPIVAMNGEPTGSQPGGRVFTLAQPFRTEDVLEILHQAAVF